MIIEVLREKQRLDHIFDMAHQLNANDELIAHWAKYLCVLTSGFIENSIRMLLSQYTMSRASPPVVNYVESTVKGVRNLNDEKIAQLLGSFSAEWRDTFIQMRTEAQKAAIDSVVANRHQIAHGRFVGLTLGRMKQYYDEIIKAIALVDEQCVNK